MSEENLAVPAQDVEDSTAAEVAEPSADASPGRTGHAGVDEVLESLEDLDEIPVAEQVAVFESAHDKLRAALADAGNEPDA